MKNIKSFNAALPKEKHSNVIVIKNNIVKEKDLKSFLNQFNNIKNEVLCFVFANYFNNKIIDFQIIKKNYDVLHFGKNTMLLNKQCNKNFNINKIKNINIVYSMYLYVVINFLFYFIYFIRMIKKRLINKFLNLFN